MGVKVKDALDSSFFKEFKLLAGFNGLDREIQAVSFFDAPDGFKWIKGKEFIVTSGYFLNDNTDLFVELVEFINKQNAAALGIKTERYIDDIPVEAIELCNKLSIPLIHIPYDMPWIDLINEVNSIAMNSYITRLKNHKNMDKNINRSDDFNEKKNKKIETLSRELNCPITLIDTIENTKFTYPNNYSYEKNKYFDEEGDYKFDYKKQTLCSELNIHRIENIEKDNYSFIVMPIVLKNREVGRVIVWESKRKLDYYDIFPVRLSYILLLEIYELIYLVNSFERIFYDDLIYSLIDGQITTKDKLIKSISSIQDFKLDIDNKFLVVSIKQIKNVSTFYSKREHISTMLLFNFPKDRAIFGILGDDIISIVIDVTDGKFKEDRVFSNMIKSLYSEVDKMFSDSTIKIGVGLPVNDICNIKRSYQESIKAIDIGKYLYEEKDIIKFNELGPFGLFKLDNMDMASFGNTFQDLELVFNEPNSDELLETLSAFLDNECNYNSTGQKLHIHSNTVRYRIKKIKELCNLDFDNSMERVKMILTLKFLEGLK